MPPRRGSLGGIALTALVLFGSAIFVAPMSYAEETAPAAEPDLGVVRPTYGAFEGPGTTPPSSSAAASAVSSAESSTSSSSGLGPTRHAAVTPSLAGRPAGEGRQRPGRPVSPSVSPSDDASPGAASGSADPARTKTATAPGMPPEDEPEAEAVPETESPAAADPPRSPPAAAYEPAAQTADTLADRQIPVLTLGVGLAMMGLGLGFLGLRIRRR